MNKKTLLLSVILSSFAISGIAKDEAKDADLYQQFDLLSQQSIKQTASSLGSSNAFSPDKIFIEQEIPEVLKTSSLNLGESLNSALSSSESSWANGQWSVSFDLNQLGMTSTNWDFPQKDEVLEQSLNFDWDLGTSLVSPDQTSRFYINYGDRKVPVSISFDDVATTLSQEAMSLGFQQELNESWDVSISYLKADNKLSQVANSNVTANSVHQQDFAFDFNRNNRIETVNFSPYSQDLAQTSFMGDISAINIKVSRKMSDNLLLSAKASKEQAKVLNSFENTASGTDELAAYDGRKLALEGSYQLNDSWSMGANLQHQQLQALNSAPLLDEKSEFNQIDSTTLDIGVQYQSNWEQVGVVIRIDLLNLLGSSNTASDELNVNNSGLKPFSFDTPKYIKVSGSINF